MTERFKRLGVAIATALLLVPTVSAKQYLNEDFAYPAGDLYNQGGWLQYGNQSAAPIQVGATALTYPGYQDAAKGSAVTLNGENNAQDQRLWKEISGSEITSGALYASMLINVNAVPANNYFFSFIATGYSGFADKKTGTLYGKVMVDKGSTESTYKIGIGKTGAAGTLNATASQELDLGKTYLVVLKYQFVDGDKNDVVSLWVNPVTDGTEPSDCDATYTGGSDPKNLRCASLYQSGSSVRQAPELTIDALRVADTWADLFQANTGGDQPTDTPSFSIDNSSLDIATYAGYQYHYPVVVKASNLTDDITVTLPATGELAANTTVIPKDAAMSSDGYTLEVWSVATAACEAKPLEITLSAPGCDDKKIGVSLTVYPTTEVKNAGSPYKNLVPDDYMTLYRYTGKGVITFVDTKGGVAYGQDNFGGFAVKATMLDGAFPFKVGDQVTDLFFYVIESFGSRYMDLALPSATVLSEGNVKEPTELSLSELSQDWDYYINRLVVINGVEFKDAAGKKFATTATEITSGDATGKVRAFPDTDLIGTDLPTGTVAITGIVTSKTGIISLRSNADVVAAPSFEVTKEQLFDGQAAPINTDTPVGRFTVKAQNLPKAAMVYIGGTDRAMYSLDVEEIPAGNSETTITVTYHPTTIGKHTGRLQFDVTPTELSQGMGFTFAAYDPDNLPSVTADASALQPFVAAVGETQEQSFTVTTANMIDYGTAKVMQEGNGAFRISSATLLKSGETTLRVTFAPQAEGTFTERIELSGMMVAEPVYVTVTGSTNAGPAPEVKEGDEFILSTASPLKLMTEGFDGVTSNKPLAVSGWVNNATVGNRAWWGYTFADDSNSAAKVTAYDSKATESEPCQMTLVTPALDFVNAESKLLTFRLMGDNMRTEQEDRLEVLYIEPVEGAEPYMEVLQGMQIPADGEQNGQWIDYLVDLEGQNIADAFFIGFRFTSNRGHDNSTIYYVDDVTWGRTDVPVIKVTSHEAQGTLGLARIEASVNMPKVERVTVSGKNLKEDIKLALKGEKADCFTLSAETLPAAGGDIDVTFRSANTGEHAAYIEMTSNGAATFNMMLIANVSEQSGITLVPADADGLFRVYNMSGVNVLTTASPADIETLAPGLYIVNGVKYLKN